jgi:hypothetical protein
MARQFILLIALLVSTLGATVRAQTPETPALKTDATPAASPVEKKNRPERPFVKFGDSADFAQKLFDRLTPEEKERFKENFERWKALPPEERQALMMHEKMRRERMMQEIDEAIKKSGLQLDKDRREMFTLRYSQERRKIEEQLRREMEEKRRPQLQEMLGRLVTEFSAPATPAPSPAASPAPAAN